MARIPPELLRSEKFIVLIGTEGNWRRLINLRFQRRPNGLEYQVDLPHFAHSRGVLRRFTIDGPPRSETQIDLAEDGTTTSHILKYSHHPDGRAQFSQDGRHVTQITTRTRPLENIVGHLFTVNYWGADAFRLAAAKDLKLSPPRTCPLFIDTTSDNRPASELSGRLIAEAYRLRHFSINSAMPRNGDWSRPIVFRRGDGTVGQGTVALPPDPRPRDFLIMLSHYPMDRAGATGGTSLVFTGGFHAPGGIEGPVSAIGMNYQDRDSNAWAQTVARIGNSDYSPADDMPQELTITDHSE